MRPGRGRRRLRGALLEKDVDDQDEAAAARPPLERAPTTHEACEGAQGPRVATALANLALIRRALGAIAEAEALLARALVITRG